MTPWEEYQQRPMSLRRVETAMTLNDCVAQVMPDEKLSQWHRDGLQLVYRLQDESEGLEQHAPEAQREVFELANNAV